MKKAKVVSYSETLTHLKSLHCSECFGSGVVDNADLGDITFSTFTCSKCNGTGFKNGITYKLVLTK